MSMTKSLNQKSSQDDLHSFMTLSCGKPFFNDEIFAQIHLDLFLHKLAQHLNIKNVPHACIAERNERFTILYRLLTPYHVDRNWLNDNWDGRVYLNYKKQSEILPYFENFIKDLTYYNGV
jgi:hypothetical protein